MKSIMPINPLYSTERFEGSHKHHCFGNTANRKKSEKYGLFIYLTPEMHNMSNKGIHFDKAFDLQVKQIAQETAMNYYGWSIDEFRQVFGKNYLD